MPCLCLIRRLTDIEVSAQRLLSFLPFFFFVFFFVFCSFFQKGEKIVILCPFPHEITQNSSNLT